MLGPGSFHWSLYKAHHLWLVVWKEANVIEPSSLQDGDHLQEICHQSILFWFEYCIPHISYQQYKIGDCTIKVVCDHKHNEHWRLPLGEHPLDILNVIRKKITILKILNALL